MLWRLVSVGQGSALLLVVAVVALTCGSQLDGRQGWQRAIAFVDCAAVAPILVVI